MYDRPALTPDPLLLAAIRAVARSGDPDAITAAQTAIHSAARGLLSDLEDHDQDEPEGEDVHG